MWATNDRWILPEMLDFHVSFRNLLHAVNLGHGTDGFTSPPKEGVLRIFFALKNPTASAGFEPANLATKGQHATSRPPKPLRWRFVFFLNVNLENRITWKDLFQRQCRIRPWLWSATDIVVRIISIVDNCGSAATKFVYYLHINRRRHCLRISRFWKTWRNCI